MHPDPWDRGLPEAAPASALTIAEHPIISNTAHVPYLPPSALNVHMWTGIPKIGWRSYS